jgi:hypothetical protein
MPFKSQAQRRKFAELLVLVTTGPTFCGAKPSARPTVFAVSTDAERLIAGSANRALT